MKVVLAVGHVRLALLLLLDVLPVLGCLLNHLVQLLLRHGNDGQLAHLGVTYHRLLALVLRLNALKQVLRLRV